MKSLAHCCVLLGILSLSIATAGCGSASTWGTTVRMGPTKYPSVKAEQVMILFETPTKAHEQIGIVSAIGGIWANEGDMLKKMQKEAAGLGADAIVVRQESNSAQANGNGVAVVQSQKSGFEYPRTTAIAIKYR